VSAGAKGQAQHEGGPKNSQVGMAGAGRSVREAGADGRERQKIFRVDGG
jgi:hypothetical protein